MADSQHNLDEEQQDIVDHLMNQVHTIIGAGTFEDEDELVLGLQQFQFELESIISSSSPGTQTQD